MRRRTRRLLGLGVTLVVLGVAGKFAAIAHVRHVTGVHEVAHTNCITCHGGGEPLTYVRGTAHATPFDLCASPDGASVYAACGPLKRIAEVDVAARTMHRWIDVAGEPGGVAVSPDGTLLAVTLSDARTLQILDRESGTSLAKVGVGLEPAGLAFGADGTTLFVANGGSGDVSVVDVATRRETLRVPAGREPFRVVTSPDGRRVAVISRMMSITRADQVPYSELTLIDAATGRVERSVRLPSFHQAEGIAFSPDGSRVLVPGLRARNLLPITQVARGWVVSGVLCSVDAATGSVAILPLGTVNRPFPDPAGIAATAERVYVVSAGSNTLAAVDLTTALSLEDSCGPDVPEPEALTRRYLGARVPTASEPGGVVLADGVVAVAERLDDSVALYAPDTLELVARVPLGPRLEDDAVRRGARVFHDASYAFQGSFACRSCHPGGHTDGLTYDFDIDGVGKNIVLNRSLHGVKGTAPFKWSGLNPTLARQCGARFAMVLTRADVFPEDKLNDLVAYIESFPPPRPTGGSDDLLGFVDPAAERGRAIFFRTTDKHGRTIPPDGRCVTCHPPPHYSNLGKADVYTQSPWDKSGLVDVPHLTGIGRKAPYLHDGRAISLEEIWTAPGVENHHGVVTDLKKPDLNDLIEFLRGL